MFIFLCITFTVEITWILNHVWQKKLTFCPLLNVYPFYYFEVNFKLLTFKVNSFEGKEKIKYFNEPYFPTLQILLYFRNNSYLLLFNIIIYKNGILEEKCHTKNILVYPTTTYTFSSLISKLIYSALFTLISNLYLERSEWDSFMYFSIEMWMQPYLEFEHCLPITFSTAIPIMPPIYQLFILHIK